MAKRPEPAAPPPGDGDPASWAGFTNRGNTRQAARDFRTRWTDAQAAFVDSPREAVQRADSLVAEAMKRLAEVFSKERANLEGQWDRGDNVTTEDLRIALQRYRAFFDRLLNV